MREAGVVGDRDGLAGDVLLVDQAVERMPRGAAGGMESLVRRAGCERDDLRHRRIPHHQFPRFTIRLDAAAPLAGGTPAKRVMDSGGVFWEIW